MQKGSPSHGGGPFCCSILTGLGGTRTSKLVEQNYHGRKQITVDHGKRAPIISAHPVSRAIRCPTDSARRRCALAKKPPPARSGTLNNKVASAAPRATNEPRPITGARKTIGTIAVNQQCSCVKNGGSGMAATRRTHMMPIKCTMTVSAVIMWSNLIGRRPPVALSLKGRSNTQHDSRKTWALSLTRSPTRRSRGRENHPTCTHSLPGAERVLESRLFTQLFGTGAGSAYSIPYDDISRALEEHRHGGRCCPLRRGYSSTQLTKGLS